MTLKDFGFEIELEEPDVWEVIPEIILTKWGVEWQHYPIIYVGKKKMIWYGLKKNGEVSDGARWLFLNTNYWSGYQ